MVFIGLHYEYFKSVFSTNLIKKLYLFSTIFFFLLGSTIVNGQISIDLIHNSDLIVEGKIIKQNCIDGDAEGRIYTLNTINVFKVFKGELDSKLITLVTLGGTIDRKVQTWSHVFSASNQQAGIFFLQKNKTLEDGFFSVIGENNGFISFTDYENSCPKAYYSKWRGANIPNNVYDELEKTLNSKFQIIALNEYEETIKNDNRNSDCVEYRITNIRLTQVNNSSTNAKSLSYIMEFDIDIRSLGNSFLYEKTAFSMSYSKEIFGEYIVGKNKMIIEMSNSFDDYHYQLNDENDVKWKVTIDKNDNVSGIIVNNYYQNLFKATFQLNSIDPSMLLSLKVDGNNDLKTYKNLNGVVSQIDCSIFNKNINASITNFAAPEITSINTSTVTAGTKTLLTITGKNLWPPNVSNRSEVWFTNAFAGDNGEWIKPLSGDYKLVENDKIEVYVPTAAAAADKNEVTSDRYYAGTGSVKVVVKATTGNLFSLPKKITVRYAVKNDNYNNKSQPIFLSKHNDKGGYSIAYTDAFKNKKDIKGNKFSDAFEKALKKWQCTTGLNYRFTSSTTNYDILIDYMPFPLNNTSTFAATNTENRYEDVCDMSISNKSSNHPEIVKVDFLMPKIKLTYNSLYTQLPWDALSLDALPSVERIALHELGHAHNLLHDNDPNSLMYWQALSTTLTPEAVNASNYILDHSEKPTSCAVEKFVRYDCKTPTKDFESNLNLLLQIDNEHIAISNPAYLSIESIHIFDISGKSIWDHKIPNINLDNISLDNPLVSSGIYIVKVKCSEGSKSFKIINHKN